MTTEPLNTEERAYLLTLARDTITEATGRKPVGKRPPAPPRLNEPGAAFVTLHTRDGELRGCIGSLMAHRPLVEDVRENALAAAFRDPRFPQVKAAELPNIVIEVSVLTAPQPLDFDGADDLIRKLRPHVDGVIIERGWNRATFLPQVWEQLPSPEEFLTHLCYKAGLPGNAWRWPDLEVSIYQVEEFSEKV
ncbi:MAG TPA: AmmeMemoRadiSam system protein A [Anaerolineae bacterium]|nr:AmmeMemoRadiSam system protein A [Anaerolineae bacterium]HQI84663.1 AmmeMemoRadiSam system protein A [Anaerolineae bacterium]